MRKLVVMSTNQIRNRIADVLLEKGIQAPTDKQLQAMGFKGRFPGNEWREILANKYQPIPEQMVEIARWLNVQPRTLFVIDPNIDPHTMELAILEVEGMLEEMRYQYPDERGLMV